MARGKLTNRRQVTDAPFVISSPDPAVQAYVDALDPGAVFSTTAGLQWGFEIDGGNFEVDGGSAYIVSAEAFKRIDTGRFDN